MTAPAAADADPVLLVFTSLPDPDQAAALGQALVEQGLAACVNVLAGCRSIYRWRGAVERADEVPLLIKTTAAAYPRLEQVIRARHGYELPEIVAVPVSAGLPDYLAWVREQIG